MNLVKTKMKNLKRFTRIFAASLFLLLVNCNPSNNNKKVDVATVKDTINDVVTVKETIPKVKIDSVKMHAFDSLYFFTGGTGSTKTYTVNDIEYQLTSTRSLENGAVFYFMLVNITKITTVQKAKMVVNELKNTISKKYKNGITLNKTYYIKHPEEKSKNERPFDKRVLFKYDEKIVGLPYEFVASKWNLKYKEIQIGYLIDHKIGTKLFQSTPKDDYYIIYIELTSKVLKPKKTMVDNTEKDANKF
jgi:hypothetical protein